MASRPISARSSAPPDPTASTCCAASPAPASRRPRRSAPVLPRSSSTAGRPPATSRPIRLIASRETSLWSPSIHTACSGADRRAASSRAAVDFAAMGEIRIVDITDIASFGLIPPCADPGFDHRSCDYWEDDARGSKAARSSWLEPSAPMAKADAVKPSRVNPFLADLEARAPAANPFATARPANPFLSPGEEDAGPIDNPFAPRPVQRPTVGTEAPRKLQLLGRGLGVAGRYAKVLSEDDVARAYAQFGPLTAYPCAQRTRDLYPALPDTPLPAVITCNATTAEARGAG